MGTDWTDFAVSGVSETTPTNIMLGAGTLYKNITYSAESSKWSGTILGATSGGNKLSIKPEITNIEVDGVLVEAKGLIHDDDYIQNFAFVGFKTDGSPIVVLFDYAICTEGLESDNKNKETAVIPAVYKCVAELTAGGNTNKLPYHIYVPKSSATQAVQSAQKALP